MGRSCVTVPRVTSGVQSTIDYLPAVNGYGKLSSEFRIHRPLAGQREDRADMHFGHSASPQMHHFPKKCSEVYPLSRTILILQRQNLIVL